MTHQHDRHAHAHTTLAHPYWRRVEHPQLSQLREPDPEPAARPFHGRVLHALGAAQEHVLELAAAEVANTDELAISAALTRLRATVHVAAGYGYERDDLPREFVPMREGHTTPQSRSKWKRKPGTFRRWSMK